MLDKHSLAELADIYKQKYNRLLKNNVELERQIDEGNSEIEQLRKERDEARRLYCEEAFAHRFNERRFNERGGLGPITDPKQIAQGMKWDCFKENTNDTN